MERHRIMMDDLKRSLAPPSFAPHITPKAPPARSFTPRVPRKEPTVRNGSTSQFDPKPVPDTPPPLPLPLTY
eukprot:scaffold22132_cov119-Isochrysis_galbana.AAC.5